MTEIIPEFEELDRDAEHITRARLRLTHVSRKWRTVASSTSQLWTTIALIDPVPNDVNVIEQWFKNSGTRPLDISFEPGLLADDSTLIKVIRDNISRTRCLLAYDDIVNKGLLAAIFPPNSVTDAPALEALRIHSTNLRLDPEGLVNAPSLIYLHKNDYSVTHNFIINSTISLRSFSGATYSMPFVTKCSNLTELILYVENTPLYPPRGIVFPALERLSLIPRRGLGNNCIERFVRWIKCPSLTTLEVWTQMESTDGGVTCGNILDGITQEHGSNLRHLTLGCVSFEGHDLKDPFSNLPHLRTLSLKCSRLTDNLVQALMPSLGPPSSWPCPELSELEMSNTNIATMSAAHSLVQLIYGRMLPSFHQTNEHRPGYFGSVVLSTCYGDGFRHERLWDLFHQHRYTFKIYH